MNVIQKQQELELKKYDVCFDILRNARNELYLGMRFMDVALSALQFLPDNTTQSMGCDGAVLHFQADTLIQSYQQNPILVNRQYLHQIMHCLFGHIWKKPQDMQTEVSLQAGDIEIEHLQELTHREQWDLACDIAAEYLVDSFYLRCVRVVPSAVRRYCYLRLEEQMKTVTAERVYEWLKETKDASLDYRRLATEFRKDDHQFWYDPSKNKSRPEKQQEWDNIREKMQTEIELFSKEHSDEAGSMKNALQVENRERYDYREFLRKFSVLKEEMQVDMDTFDYIFYNYGMSLYGNMPLIEPLETKEVQKIEDFVIVIDTSMSCNGELVKIFLEQTYEILSQAESFYRKINIRIIQCDEKVQDDVKIENGEQLRHYMEHMEIKGLGGTDFRPAFLYVQELLAKREFYNLKGLLYFTDGYGRYPVKKPLYDVAFVFIEKDYQDVDVPPWAMKLILTEDEIKYEH
ncbi:MAG: VWA-like domain-containing protein [Ruminococcus sp.]|nr:VWA-like domain-containing protein [Ruminococcus sp.]